jgi:tetratricopeptide (TPR) repeat protein
VYTLGEAYDKLGRNDDAIRLYKEASSLDAKYIPPLINLGRIYDDSGLYDEALGYLTQAVKLAPDSFEVNNNLGNVYLHKSLYQDAVRHYRKAINLKLDAAATRYNLGLAYQELGQADEAQVTFTELIKISSTYWDAYHQLALILIKKGDKPGAKALLENLLAKNPNYSKKDEVKSLLAKL